MEGSQSNNSSIPNQKAKIWFNWEKYMNVSPSIHNSISVDFLTNMYVLELQTQQNSTVSKETHLSHI